MGTCTASLCLAIIAVILLRTSSPRKTMAIYLPFMVLAVVILFVAGFAVKLDSESGEGTAGFAFVLFFAPCTLASVVVSHGLWVCGSKALLKALACSAMFPLALILQWFYEPSSTGGPNFLAMPLLMLQAIVWGVVGELFRRASPPEVEPLETE